MQEVTLCLLLKQDKILLGIKKRGFGVGKWNGFGGKLENNETVEENVAREPGEEIGVLVDTDTMKKVGRLDFHFKDKPEWNQKMHIFLVKNWEREPMESEEMKPRWFDVKNIPFDKMWLDDKYWLPTVLAGKKIEGKFYFINEGAQIDDFNIREV